MTSAPSSLSPPRTRARMPLPPLSSSPTSCRRSRPAGARPPLPQPQEKLVDRRGLPLVVTGTAAMQRPAPCPGGERVGLSHGGGHDIEAGVDDEAAAAVVPAQDGPQIRPSLRRHVRDRGRVLRVVEDAGRDRHQGHLVAQRPKPRRQPFHRGLLLAGDGREADELGEERERFLPHRSSACSR
jgi:hypothetical protein